MLPLRSTVERQARCAVPWGRPRLIFAVATTLGLRLSSCMAPANGSMESGHHLRGAVVLPLTLADAAALENRLRDLPPSNLQQLILAGSTEGLLRRFLPGQRHAPIAMGVRHSNRLQAVVIALPCNQSSCCWKLQRLQICSRSTTLPRSELLEVLVRGAIGQAPQARSWFVRASLDDNVTLSALRGAGFQALLGQRIYRLAPAEPEDVMPQLGSGLTWSQLKPREGAALRVLENAASPIQLRQLLDRSVDDLLEETRSGLVVLDEVRGQLAAALRWVQPGAGAPLRIDVTVHPGYHVLYSQGLSQLLHRLLRQRPLPLPGAGPIPERLQLRCCDGNKDREQWLLSLGASAVHDELLLARSIWRRQDRRPTSRLGAEGLARVLEQLAPRRTPIPDGAWRCRRQDH